MHCQLAHTDQHETVLSHKLILIEAHTYFSSAVNQPIMRKKRRLLTWETVDHAFQVRHADCYDRWPATPLPTTSTASTAPACTLLFQVFAYCCMQVLAMLADVSWLAAIVAHLFSPLAICSSHSYNACTLGCVGSARKPALKMASAYLALLVLVPWWGVHMHECIGVCQSTHHGVDVGMGQRRSHVVQLLVYIQQLVSKLSIRDRLIYG